MREFEAAYADGRWFNRKFLHQDKEIKGPEEVRRQLKLDSAKANLQRVRVSRHSATKREQMRRQGIAHETAHLDGHRHDGKRERDDRDLEPPVASGQA